MPTFNGLPVILMNAPGLPNSTEPSVKSDLSSNSYVASTITDLVETQRRSLEFSTKQVGLPISWLTENWRESLGQIANQGLPIFDSAIASMIDNPYGNTRKLIGRIIVTLFDLGLWAFLLVKLYQLLVGFISANFVSGNFVLNAIMLGIALLLTGITLLSICFPPIEQALQVTIETKLRNTWYAYVDTMKQSLNSFAEMWNSLQQDDNQFKNALENELQRYNHLLAAAMDKSEPDLENLYSTSPPTKIEESRGGGSSF